MAPISTLHNDLVRGSYYSHFIEREVRLRKDIDLMSDRYK